jgi:hypothetical protein
LFSIICRILKAVAARQLLCIWLILREERASWISALLEDKRPAQRWGILQIVEIDDQSWCGSQPACPADSLAWLTRLSSMLVKQYQNIKTKSTVSTQPQHEIRESLILLLLCLLRSIILSEKI